MLNSLTVSVLIGLAVLFGWSSSLAAQSTQELAPVPGPYSAAPTPRAATASRSAARSMRQMMPYWMRPSQSRQALQSGQRQQQFIPGWVWSPSAPAANAQRQYRPAQRPIAAYGYQNGPRNPYLGPGPMWQQMPPWQQQYQGQNWGQNTRPNPAYGAPPQYGGQQQNRRQYRPQYQTPSN